MIRSFKLKLLGVMTWLVGEKEAQIIENAEQNYTAFSFTDPAIQNSSFGLLVRTVFLLVLNLIALHLTVTLFALALLVTYNVLEVSYFGETLIYKNKLDKLLSP